MLKCLGFQGPALINNGEDTTPLMFHSARDAETKQKHSPGSLQSAGFSPSSTLSSRTSPPIRQPSNADALSEPLRSSNYSLPKMESVPESTQRLSANGRSTGLGERFDSKCVMVAVDATEKLTLGALQFALQNSVNPGDRLYLLGVLHKIIKDKRYKQKVDIGTEFGGIQTSLLENERARKEEEFESAIADHEIQKLFVSKQITPEVVIGTGPDRKVVTRSWAEQLEATWVILDKNLKKDKSYLRDHLNCNIVMLKQKNEPAVLVKVYRDDSISYRDSQEAMSIELNSVHMTDPIRH